MRKEVISEKAGYFYISDSFPFTANMRVVYDKKLNLVCKEIELVLSYSAVYYGNMRHSPCRF